MKKLSLVLLVISILSLMNVSLLNVSLMSKAKASESAIVLNIEDIRKRAKDNYLDVKLAKLNKMATAAQLKYTSGQLEQVTSNDKSLSPTVLPTTLESLRALIEGYEELSEEQKNEIDYMLSIQILINQSLNPILYGSYVSQSFQNDSSIHSLKDNMHSQEGQIKLHELEINRVEALVQYQAAYMYYELIKLSNEIKIQKIITKQASQRAEDLKRLKQIGYAQSKELEQAERNKEQQQYILLSLEQQQSQQLSVFASELGFKDKEQIELLNPLIPLKATQLSFEDKKVLEQNIDYKIEQQKLATELDKYEEATWFDLDLTVLQKQSVAIQEMRLELAQGQVKSKISSLKFEGSGQYDKLQQQELKIQDQEQRKAEYEHKYKAGLVSISELEEVQLQYQIEQLQLLNKKLEYEQFHEKWRLAILGVLL